MSLSLVAKLAPLLVKLPPVAKVLAKVTKPSEKDSVLEAAADIASKYFGTDSGSAIADQLRTVEGRLNLERELAEQEHKLELALLADRADARKMYSTGGAQSTTDHIAHKVMQWNVYWVIGLIVVQLLFMYFLRDYGQLLTVVGNVVGFVVAQLLSERGDVIGFYFGSSEGSKSKDKFKGN